MLQIRHNNQPDHSITNRVKMPQWMLLLIRDPVFLLYQMFLFLWVLLQETLVNLLSPRRKRHPVRVYRILYRRKRSQLAYAEPSDFLSVFCGTSSAKALSGANVSLYCLKDNVAYFVCTCSGVPIHRSDISPFFYVAQWHHATHLLAVPYDHFLDYAQTLDRGRVLLLWNTGRCGSTLLTQMLEATESVISLSEPMALRCLQMDLLFGHGQHTGPLLQATLASLAHYASNHAPGQLLCIKPTAASIALLPLCHQFAPYALHLFLYRQGAPTIASYCKLFGTMNAGVNQVWRRITACTRDLKGCADQVRDVPTAATFLWADVVAQYLAYQEEHGLHCVRYEELTKEPEKCLHALSQAFRFSWGEDQIQAALAAMQQDSQRGTGREKLHTAQGGGRINPLPQAEACEDLCRRMGVPLPSENCLLPGTITDHQSQ